MKRVRDLAILSALVASAVALPACPPSLGDRCDEGACLAGAQVDDGGGDGRDADTPDAPVPPDCNEDADATSAEAKGCMVDTFAVFVDGVTGDDTNPGTKDKPFKKIATAIAKGPPEGKRRVYVCGPGPYAEHLKLTTAVHLFGGFACGTWTPDEATKAKVAPTDAGYALHVDSVSAPLRFENMAFEAIAGTAASPSSIAAFVASSPNVVLRRVDLKANDGFTSLPGQAGAMGNHDTTPDGNNGTATQGGAEKMCTCSFGGTTKGGKGGDTQGTESGGSKGAPAIVPPVPGTATGEGSSRSECEGGTGGKRGSDAPPALFQPKPSVGALDATGWHPGDGAKGVNGTPGQGGGGGGSYTIGAAGQNGGGGGGACGGCGGSGGDGGKGGGASVALLAFNAPVTLKTCLLEATKAGNGAEGRDGGPGSSGGSRGNGGNTACPGGNGGNGGKGGAGAGGAGGVSAAVLHKGDVPINEGSTLKSGSKGTGAAGGRSPENDGPDGLEGEIVPAPQE